MAHAERVRVLLWAGRRPRCESKGRGCRRVLDSDGGCPHCLANSKTRVAGKRRKQIDDAQQDRRAEARTRRAARKTLLPANAISFDALAPVPGALRAVGSKLRRIIG